MKRVLELGPAVGLTVAFGMAIASAGCGKKDAAPDEELGQQVGDVMASIDESGGNSNGTLASLESQYRTLARVSPKDAGAASLGFIENAYATGCATGSTFSSCSNNVITRDFNGCTILGAVTLTGTVTFTWTDAAVDSTCQMTASGHSVSRSPSFTITGRRGGSLAVSKTGTVGQKITKGSGTAFTFSNDGIRRVVTSGSTTLFDFTTSTVSDMTITGTSRSGRVLNGGTLRVLNNSSGVSCDFTPSNVTWGSTCNCPTSGSWSATCSDGKTSSLSITGCGTGSLTVGDSEATSVSFDRCYGV